MFEKNDEQLETLYILKNNQFNYFNKVIEIITLLIKF